MSTSEIVCHEDDRIGRWISQRTGDEWQSGRGRGIALVVDGEIRAAYALLDSNGRTAWLALAAEPGQWAQPELFTALAVYAFVQLKLEWVRCKICSANVKSIRLAESVGFELETLLKDAHPSGDEIIYRMNAKSCRWLDLEKSRDEFQARKTQ